MQCFFMRPFNVFLQTTIAWQRALRVIKLTLARANSRLFFVIIVTLAHNQLDPQICLETSDFGD